jgi:hypothetical protein
MARFNEAETRLIHQYCESTLPKDKTYAVLDYGTVLLTHGEKSVAIMDRGHLMGKAFENISPDIIDAMAVVNMEYLAEYFNKCRDPQRTVVGQALHLLRTRGFPVEGSSEADREVISDGLVWVVAWPELDGVVNIVPKTQAANATEAAALAGELFRLDYMAPRFAHLHTL